MLCLCFILTNSSKLAVVFAETGLNLILNLNLNLIIIGVSVIWRSHFTSQCSDYIHNLIQYCNIGVKKIFLIVLRYCFIVI